MKKYKLIAFSLILTFMTMLSVNAREMTISELGELATAQYADEDKDVGYIYVIGEYAFTSQYDLKTEDIMLAANSIEATKDATKYKDNSNEELSEEYKKMVIETIRAELNDNFEIESWEVSKAAVGTSQLESSGTSEAKVNVRYIDYTFIGESSTFTVEKPNDEANGQIESSYGWKKEDAQKKGYSVDFKTEGNTVKVSGLVPKIDLTKENIFAAEHKTGYYFVYSVKVKGAKSGTTIKLGAHNKDVDPEKVIDVTGEEDEYELVLLMHVHPDDTEKKVTITVDIDGEESKEYTPYEIILDYSELKLAAETEPGTTQTPEIPEDEKDDYYDFDSTRNESITITPNTSSDNKQDYDLTGTIKEQKVSEESGFGADDGYYVVVRIQGPADSSNWTIGLHREDGSYYPYTPTQEEYSQGYVDVLYKVSRDGKEYEEDGDDKANHKKTIRYQIDADGACTASTDDTTGTGCEFDPVTVIIDYSNVTFKTATDVTFDYKYQTGEEEKKDVVTYFEGDEIDLSKNADGVDAYHELDKWTIKSEDNSKATITDNKITIEEDQENFTLEANWELDTEKFMDDIITEYSDSIANSEAADDSKAKEFTATYENQTITVTIPNESDIKVSELDNTIIPGVLKYILEHAEVTSITIGCGSEYSSQTTAITKATFDEDFKTAIKNYMTQLLSELDEQLGDSHPNSETVTFDDLFKVSDFSFTFKLDMAEGSNVTIPEGKDTFTIKFAKADAE